MTIAGGSISATGYNSGIESECGAIAIGANTGTVTAKTTAPTNSYPYAIYAEGGSVRIDGGKVTAIGYTGIYTAKGIVVNGGDVTAQTNVPNTYGGSIMAPSGIYCESDQVTVNGGSVYAKGFDYGIYSRYLNHKDDDDDEDESDDNEDDGEDEEVPVNGVIVNGGTVIAEATGFNYKGEGGFGIRVDGGGGGIMNVSRGSVQATASAKGSFAVSVPGSVTIEKGATPFVATGTDGVFIKDTSVKNAVAGTGWTNVAGTEGKADIEPNTSGQALNAYKKVQFPAASTKGAGTDKSTTAKTGDSIPYMALVATAFAALVAAVIVFTAKSRKRG